MLSPVAEAIFFRGVGCRGANFAKSPPGQLRSSWGSKKHGMDWCGRLLGTWRGLLLAGRNTYRVVKNAGLWKSTMWELEEVGPESVGADVLWFASRRVLVLGEGESGHAGRCE